MVHQGARMEPADDRLDGPVSASRAAQRRRACSRARTRTPGTATDWNPEAVSSRSRNEANDIGVIVSRMSSWPTSVFMIVRTRLRVAIAPKRSPAVKSPLHLVDLVQHQLEPEFVHLVDDDEEHLVVLGRLGPRLLQPSRSSSSFEIARRRSGPLSPPGQDTRTSRSGDEHDRRQRRQHPRATGPRHGGPRRRRESG